MEGGDQQQQQQHHQQPDQQQASLDLATHTQAREVSETRTLDALDLAMATHSQARVPDGVDYTSSALRYLGHVIPVTCMSRRNTLGPWPGYLGLEVNRKSVRPAGDKNFQRGLTGNWRAVSAEGQANWLHCSFAREETQPRVLAPGQHCTHECPQFDTTLDRNHFGEVGEKCGVKRA